jgi:hypothetical protein
MSNLEEKVAELEARLKVLEAERGILQALYRYGHVVDYGPTEQRLDCFTEDGVFHLVPKGKVTTEFHCNGRKELFEKWARDHTAAPVAYHKHVMVEPRITLLSDNEARVESMFCRWDNRDGVPYTSCYGRYVDRIVKCPDGVWRFKERTAEIETMSSALAPS